MHGCPFGGVCMKFRLKMRHHSPKESVSQYLFFPRVQRHFFFFFLFFFFFFITTHSLRSIPQTPHTLQPSPFHFFLSLYPLSVLHSFATVRFHPFLCVHVREPNPTFQSAPTSLYSLYDIIEPSTCFDQTKDIHITPSTEPVPSPVLLSIVHSCI